MEPTVNHASPEKGPDAYRRGFIQPVNPLTVDEALSRFAAPGGEKVQVLRPFAVYSAHAYSTPLTVPIGPAYLCAALEKAGYEVDLIDGIGEGIHHVHTSADGVLKFQGLTEEEIIARIDPRTRVLGVSMMFSQDWVQNRNLINAIKAAHPHLVIVAGGEHPTAMTDYVLKDCRAIDFVIRGEGELAFLELLHGILCGGDIDGLAGLSRIDDNDRLVENGLGRRVADFANLPRPAWHLCAIENFFTGLWTHGISYGRNMLIMATRGCPYQCTFCSSARMWTTRYLMRPVADVVDEIEDLVARYGANSFDFADLTAIVKRSWILEFSAELKRRNLDIVWQLPSGTRSEALDEETVQAIFDAGCKLLTYAPESGSRDSLEAIKKKLDLDSLNRSLRHAVRVGHTTKINLIIAFPHERRRHVFESLWYAARAAAMGVHDCTIAVFTPYPGSELFEEIQAQGGVSAINDDYFRDLLVQFDLTVAKSYSPHIRGWEAALYRTAGMALFYGISYLLHPRRLWRLVANVWKSDFQPRTVIEQRLHDIFGRHRLGVAE